MNIGSDPRFEMATSAGRLSGFWGLVIGIAIGILLSLACLAVIAAGLLAQSAGLSSDCKTQTASLLDTVRVEMYAPGVFKQGKWSESFLSSPDRVTKTWISSDLGAVSHLEYLVYSCGFTPSDLQIYFSDANFKTTIFQNYQDVQKTAECSQSGLTLYEFTSTYNSNNYVMDYWMQPEGNNRILDFMMAFPANRQADLQQYAQQVYPQLSSCK